MRIATTIGLLLLISVAILVHAGSHPVSAIGVADVEVTTVYWGPNAYTQNTARPGDVNDEFSILLTNVGDDVARHVNATLYIGPPLIYSSYVNGALENATVISQVAGDIDAGSSYTLTYTFSIAPNAVQGVYKYSLELNYESARELQEIDKTVPINVPIWNGELVVQGVVTNPTKIYPDTNQVGVQVTIANSGQGTAQNVELQLILQLPFSASSSGSDQIFLGNLPPGQTTSANFIIDVAENATYGQYSVTLDQTVGNQLVPIGQVPLYVAEKVKFDIVSVTPTLLHVGDSGDVVSVVIRNTGTVEADDVRVELEVGNFITGTLTDFLGTMLANETKTAFFTLDIDSSAVPGQYSYNLRFDWTQQNNALYDDYSDFITFTIQAPGVPYALIIVFVVIVGGGGGYMYMKRRKAKAAAQKPRTNQK